MRRYLLTLPVVALAIAATAPNGPAWLKFRLPGPDASAHYQYSREWKAYLAPEPACPGAENEDAPISEQEETMLCLINWARERHGVSPLSRSPLLMASSRLKADDIKQCEDFAHDACGKAPEAGMRAVGYLTSGVSAGENIALGSGDARAPKAILDGWLGSPHHRRNLLSARWSEQGIALVEASRFQRGSSVAIWASQFGAAG